MPDLKVAVVSQQAKYGYGEPICMTLEVRNLSQRRLFLVAHRAYARKVGARGLEVLVGQAALATSLYYYRFVPPDLRSVSPKATAKLPISVGLPLRESLIDNHGIYIERDVPLDGKVSVAVVIGYLLTEFRPKTNDPWGEFVQQQKLFDAPVITVNLSPH
jgi:hypothetical protein